MSDKKKNVMVDLAPIIGGSMKDLLNKDLLNDHGDSVENKPENSTPHESKPVHTEKLKEGSFLVQSSSLNDNINYFLRVKKSRKQVYIDVDTLKKLEQVLIDYKYNNENVTHIPVGTLVSAILKTFFDASGI